MNEENTVDESKHPLNLFNRDFDSEEAGNEKESGSESGEEEGTSLSGDGEGDGETGSTSTGRDPEQSESEGEGEKESSHSKVVFGDEEYTVPDEGLLTVGDKEVKVKELVDSYKGQQEIDRRFTDLDKEKKSLDKDRQFLQKAKEDQLAKIVTGKQAP